MDTQTLETEFAGLIFRRFDEAAALELGQTLVGMARAVQAPVVIDIRTPDRILFHAALPGASPLNDLWVARKSATALLFQLPSLLVGQKHRDKGEGDGAGLVKNGLSLSTHADHGGAVPIRVKGVGVVAVVTVSGLPQVEDHKLAVRGIEAIRTMF